VKADGGNFQLGSAVFRIATRIGVSASREEERMAKRSTTRAKWLVAAAAALAIVAFAPEESWAVGDPPPDPPPKPKPKEKGKQESKKKEKSSSLDQDQIYSLGYWQAKNGEHAAALATLRTARVQDDPRIQTMTGFALRKLGRVDEALPYYLKALATRPEATTTRQYLGEAYLQIGEPGKAREQLAEIAKRCGVACEDYVALAEEIARYERTRG
jgi:tetratricopeptide (TPR) repeat protein